MVMIMITMMRDIDMGNDDGDDDDNDDDDVIPNWGTADTEIMHSFVENLALKGSPFKA